MLHGTSNVHTEHIRQSKIVAIYNNTDSPIQFNIRLSEYGKTHLGKEGNSQKYIMLDEVIKYKTIATFCARLKTFPFFWSTRYITIA